MRGVRYRHGPDDLIGSSDAVIGIHHHRKAVLPMSAVQLAEYAGEYDVRGTRLEVRVAGDHLLFGRSGEVPSALHPEAADQFFFSDDDGPKVTFQRINGAVTSVKFGGTEGTKVLKPL